MSQIDRTAEAPMPEGREKVAALVFGKKLRRDGTLDQRGLAVVSKAEELYRRAGREKLTLVLSGGKSSSYVLRGVNVPSEASAMKKELVARGVAEESMLLEEGSYDTIGNVILAYPLIKSLGAKKLVLVGERPMISRAEKIVRKVMGGAYEIRTEPADEELGRAYTLYNRVKEWAAYEVVFEADFFNIGSNNIDAFTKKLYERRLYKNAARSGNA